jgi:hypothetical protein
VYNGNDARQMYLLYRHALDTLTDDFFPIVTQKSLKIMIEYIPVSKWNNLAKALKDYLWGYGEGYPQILTNTEFTNVVLFTDECGVPYISNVYGNLIAEVTGIESQYSNFDQMVSELEQNNCQQFRTLITKPTFIFVNKKLTLINYDYDLAESYGHYECRDQFNQIKREILALAGI